MNLTERLKYIDYVCDLLQDTNSLNEKRDIIANIEPECKDDFEYILEILAGQHKIGYTYYLYTSYEVMPESYETLTFREYIAPLFKPLEEHDLSATNVTKYIYKVQWGARLIGSIVNRTLRLGIGKSVLPKDGLSTMLAKAYDGKIRYDSEGYYVTEKLDGNRCVARFDGTKWLFTSRNGKPMHVDIDMSGLPTNYIYDGELLSPAQTESSKQLYDLLKNCKSARRIYGNEFNATSGMINRHSKNKQLVYNIFDIMVDDTPYNERRFELETIMRNLKSDSVRLLPILQFDTSDSIHASLNRLLDYVSDCGAEGLMINLASRNYEHKRTDGLLKFKQVNTADLRVIAIEYGEGKYYGQVGALICEANVDGLAIRCKVGSGMTDSERERWAIHSDEIIGKIVEVAYFSLSQDKDALGTNMYSLRFPRLKCVRNDKIITSIY